MTKIYLAYRREDVPKESEEVYKRLLEEFGDQRVVQDIHSIKLGRDWKEWIKTELSRTTVVIAVIGPNWLRLLKERQNDPVNDIL